jgi:hypothetical protein
VDFKGWRWTGKGEKCLPLTVRDEAKKYILAIEAPEKGDTAHVKAVFEQLFKKYGLPRYIRSDNGPPFGNVFNQWGLSRLSVWFMSLGIKIDLDDPGCPYQNGGHERMHKDMKKELQGKINGDLKAHQKEFDRWRKEFNEVRPHEALGMKTPAETYRKSSRRWNGQEAEQEYPGNMKVRMVNDRGYFNLRQGRIFMGNPFAGYYVGIKEEAGKNAEIWFNDFLMGELDRATSFTATIRKPLTHSESPWAHKGLVEILLCKISVRPCSLQKARGAQGIEAKILLAQPKDWSGKPGFLPQRGKKCAKIPNYK